MSTYATTVLGMASAQAFAAPTAFGLCTFGFSLLGGTLADRIGRKPVMIGARVILLALAWPAFALLAQHRDATSLVVVTGVLAAFSQIGGAASLAAVTEAMPPAARCLGLSVIYAVAAAVFGGLTQPALAWLLHNTSGGLAPAWLLMGITFAGLFAMAAMPETRPEA